ncbi:hypothetical protein CC2G_011192 [Coprinopsis cinerea AmutBmut pab1-1]|nr:hypothetical protein CC2G_011192 [Coprinopsis cinerea AmutBmut pab1-1]
MSDAAPGPQNLILVVGPILVGSLVSSLLFGAFLVQVFHYISSLTDKDKRKLPYLVGLIVIVEILNLSFIFHNVWSRLVASLVDPVLLVKPQATGPVIQILSGFVAASVQCFFAWRVWILASTKIDKGISVFIALLAGAELCLAIAVGIQFISVIVYGASPIKTIGTTVGMQLGAALICDAMITFAMVSLLSRYKERIMISETRNILNAITRNVVENGLITTVFASLNLAFFFARPNDMIHMAFHYVIGRLYANVLLASLNNRQRLSNSRSGTAFTTSNGGFQFTNRATEQTRVVSADIKSTARASTSDIQLSKIRALGDSDSEERGENVSGPNPDVLISVSKEVYIERGSMSQA